jgi:peptide/nickel transport system permease protein
MRLVDTQMAFPIMLLALMVIAALGTSTLNLVIVLALTGWTRFARIIRGELLSLREREFVLSAVASGAGAWRIMRRHILPNVVTAIIVVSTLELARMLLLAASLDFLGLGVQPPTPNWGRMLADGRQYMATAWWLTVLPGLAIVVVILGVTLVGDWLRVVYDPRIGRGR